MKMRSLLIAGIAIGALVGSAGAVTAQDEPSEVRSVVYSTGTAGDVPETIQPTQLQAPDGHFQLRGLQLLDIPVRFTDPRLSGLLTISSNGAGRNFSDGHARLEPRTYRIDNRAGSWTGEGERILALSLDQAAPLINHESMVLFGDRAYVGLVAYVFIELANGPPELEAVVLEVEMAPLPEPVAARSRPDVSAPRGPAADSIARGVGGAGASVKIGPEPT
jgi:hypothetical protein